MRKIYRLRGPAFLVGSLDVWPALGEPADRTWAARSTSNPRCCFEEILLREETAAVCSAIRWNVGRDLSRLTRANRALGAAT